MAGKIRSLVESQQYTAQIQSLGGTKKLDAALDALTWGISTAAEDFPPVKGFISIRSAKTDPVPWLKLPSLLVVFKIIDINSVELLWIEKSEDE